MALIGAGQPGSFCLDRHEVTILSPQNQPVTPQNGIPNKSRLVSQAGQVPTVGITFAEARKLCGTTPAQINGATYAQKHLPTRVEWLDAADGTLGEGGRAFPYGNKYEPDSCNIPENLALGKQHQLAPTGSFPRCVTPEGLFDMAGNLFEWVDPQLTVSSTLALKYLDSQGIAIQIDESGWLRASATSDLRQLDSEATGIDRNTLRRDAQGGLWMRWQGSIENPYGYLTLHNTDLSTPETMLPVQFMTTPGQPEAQLHIALSLDGSPITEKIGGSFYQNGRWPNPKRNHTPTFRGSIGFRCAAPILP